MSRTADLFPLLSSLGAAPVSGERLAKRLKITRAAVWKQIHVLENLGFPVRTQARQGYWLDGVADFSLATLSFPGTLTHWAKPHYELSTPSTQILAQKAAQGGIPEGHFWLAEVQSQGRGRLERVWSSGFGGLWFSLVLRPQVPPSRAASIGLMAALALARAIEKVTGLPARLKWPNDVLLPIPGTKKFKKAAGFLTQMSGEVDKTDWIVLGVGINVFNRIPDELENMAVSVGAGHRPRPGHSNASPISARRAGTGRAGTVPRPYNRADLLTEFLRNLFADYRPWQREGFAAFQDAYWRHYSRPEEPALLKTAAGEIRGIVRHVDASGAIIIESRRKKQAVLEGEIVL